MYERINYLSYRIFFNLQRDLINWRKNDRIIEKPRKPYIYILCINYEVVQFGSRQNSVASC